MDGNGIIDLHEFLEFLSPVARHAQNTAQEDELFEAFNMFDLNGNGFISPEELRQVIRNAGVRQRRIQEFLQVLLRAGRGEGRRRGARPASTSLGRSGRRTAVAYNRRPATLSTIQVDEMVGELIRVADCDGDGQISYTEFCRVIAGV